MTLSPVELRYRASHPYVATNSQVETDVLLNIAASPEARPVETPLATCVVIDKSKSMRGRKIECAKDAAKRVVSMHDPEDLVSVFAFSTSVSKLVKPMKAYNYARMVKAIGKLKSKGLTSLYQALQKSGKEMSKLRGYMSRILIFTDGYPTDEKNPLKYASLARSLFLSGLTSSTVGVGSYNDAILRSISDNGGGWWEHIGYPDEITEAFAREVQRAKNVVARQPTLCIRFGPNCRVLYAYSCLPIAKSLTLEEHERGFLCARLPDLSKEGYQQYVFRVSVRSPDLLGEFQLGQIAYVESRKTHSTMPIMLELTRDSELASYTDLRPRAVFAITQAIEKGTRAIELGNKKLAIEAENETKAILDDPQMRRALDETEQGKTKATQRATRAIREGESIDSRESIFKMRTGN
ncbi:MAG: VWA domain-containing protein [Thermoplasmata archaeon]